MRIIVSAVSLCLLGACADDTTAPEETSDTSAAVGSKDASAPDVASEPERGPVREVPCVDMSIGELTLFDRPTSAAIVEEESSEDGFVHAIDTTAGGLMINQSYVYARFTDGGLKKVEISDEEAFESTGWDIAFRRYVIRLNSGVSGPGEVTAARTRPNTEFASVSEEPEGLEYRTEEYYTESCDVVPHSSGIGVATALSSFWTYAECVQMTKNVYVVALADGRKVKFEVLSYYKQPNQDTCDQTGRVPMPTGAGDLHIRWDFLE